MPVLPHHIAVTKTARYYTLGELTAATTEEIWFVVHGFAQSAERFLNSFESLDNGKRFFVAPEALNRFYLKAGQEEVGATWMTREDRQAEINDYVGYLDALYDSLGVEKQKAKIIVLGFSQGVATVSRWMYQSTRRADILVFYAGEPGSELQNAQSLSSYNETKNYFIYGTEDKFITEDRLLKFRPMLADFEIISFDGRHEINTDVLRQIR